MLVVGLTGGISTGKSTVSSIIQFPIIDADKIAREVTLPNGAAYGNIIKAFSKEIPNLLKENGEINRQELGAFVFKEGNKEWLQRLNKITHPAIIKTIVYSLLRLWWEGEQIVILDVPLLFESKIDWLCNYTVTVSCSENVELQRLLARNPELTRKQAEERIAAQMSLNLKESKSDYVLDNNGTIEQLQKGTTELQQRLSNLSTGFTCGIWRWIVKHFFISFTSSFKRQRHDD